MSRELTPYGTAGAPVSAREPARKAKGTTGPSGPDRQCSRLAVRPAATCHHEHHGGKTHVLIIVQNLPVPLGPPGLAGVPGARRGGLRRLGDLPEGAGRPRARRPSTASRSTSTSRRPQAEGLLGFAVEFVYSLAAHGAAVAAGVAAAAGSTSSRPATRRTPTGCSPGSGAARGAVRLRPARPEPRAVPVPVRRADARAARCEYAALLWLERMTYRTADHVISTNESYQADRRSSAAAVDPAARHGRPQRAGHPADASGVPARAAARGRRHLAGLPRHHGPAGRRRHDPAT